MEWSYYVSMPSVYINFPVLQTVQEPGGRYQLSDVKTTYYQFQVLKEFKSHYIQ